MSKQPNNFPCVCSHSWINHNSINLQTWCLVLKCDCSLFVADNLRFLEKKVGPTEQ